EIVSLSKESSRKKYAGKRRRVCVWREKHNGVTELITKNLKWTANTISEHYKSRWSIEMFFRELKTLLHTKSYMWTNENAVMIQIWTALITILILKALRAMAKYQWHLSNLIAFIRLNLFVKIDLKSWLDQPFDPPRD